MMHEEVFGDFRVDVFGTEKNFRHSEVKEVSNAAAYGCARAHAGEHSYDLLYDTWLSETLLTPVSVSSY